MTRFAKTGRGALAALAVCVGVAVAEPPRRIYIAPDDHTDYLWTADEDTYRRVFIEMIDYYLDQADRTAKNRPEHRSRWNCDGSFWMWTYERSKTPEQFERFLGRVRDGHISVPLNALTSCYGGMPLEAVLRGMYYSGRIERKHNLRFPLVVAMENQTLPYGLGALWAGSGAKYSWRGICGCASRLLPVRNTRRPHEIYWWEGLDGSRILMKWNSLFTNNKSIGGYAEAFDPTASLHFVETSPGFREAWPYRIVGIFGKGWDDLATMDEKVVTLAREATNSERTVIVSN
jgi:alpha-mannosidase